MGFWDTIQSYIPETERTKMYKAENALRLRSLQRQEEMAQAEQDNMLRKRSIANEVTNPSAAPYYPEFIVQDQQRKGLDMIDQERALNRLRDKFYPQQFTGKLGPNEVGYVNGQEVARGPEPNKTPAEVEIAKWLFGGDEAKAREYMLQRGAMSAASTSLNPTYGEDENGNIVIMQANNRGELVKSAVPQGIRPLAPRDLAYERSAGMAQGRTDVDRAAAAPAIIETAQNSLRNIRDLKNHPGLSSALGMVEGRLPAIAGEQADVVSRMEQIQGQAFLQAFNTLKGGGQITETEGAKATQALARLNRAMEPKDYRAALTELEQIMERGLERAQRGLGTPAPQSIPTEVPDPLGIRGK